MNAARFIAAFMAGVLYASSLWVAYFTKFDFDNMEGLLFLAAFSSMFILLAGTIAIIINVVGLFVSHWDD